jgi:hypothetical protein
VKGSGLAVRALASVRIRKCDMVESFPPLEDSIRAHIDAESTVKTLIAKRNLIFTDLTPVSGTSGDYFNVFHLNRALSSKMKSKDSLSISS